MLLFYNRALINTIIPFFSRKRRPMNTKKIKKTLIVLLIGSAMLLNSGCGKKRLRPQDRRAVHPSLAVPTSTIHPLRVIPNQLSAVRALWMTQVPKIWQEGFRSTSQKLRVPMSTRENMVDHPWV